MKLQFYILVFVLFLLASPLTAQKKLKASDIPTVDFCDLINQPAKYDKKIIRTKAIYVSGYHGTSLYDYRCNSGEASVSADGEEDSDVFKTKKNVSKKYDEIINKSEEHRAYVTVIGRFNDWNGYGHGSYGWYRFEFALFSFESIKPVASTVPWIEKNSDFMEEVHELRGLNLSLITQFGSNASNNIFSSEYVFYDLQGGKLDKSKFLEMVSVAESIKHSKVISPGGVFIDGNKALTKAVHAIAFVCPDTILYEFQCDNYYEKQDGNWKLIKTQIISEKSLKSPLERFCK